ncbi:hypothetical protein ASG76_01970 [Nocardioides sp. Soil774]|nr:hypothetical protein ASG76_01970 [Nocardioides sp. Soil774]
MCGVLMTASKDPDAKLTYITTTNTGAERVAVKIPTTSRAGLAVEREGRMLVDLRRLGLGRISSTVPRYVSSLHVQGRPVLVSSAVAGTPMSVAYHRGLHTARPGLVRADLDLALGWLRELWDVSQRGDAALTWARDTAAGLCGRWDGHPSLEAALSRLEMVEGRMSGLHCTQTAVHGDFWFGNVLVDHGTVTGVVDWEAGSTVGCPLRDLARFAISYSLYLDRHTRPGARVLGHRGLRRDGAAPGVTYALEGDGWFSGAVRSFLADGLTALRLPRSLWYDVALVGVAEVAASANDDGFGERHLELLSGLALRPRRRR